MALLVFAFMFAAPMRAQTVCATRTDVRDLPLIELPSSQSGEMFAVFVTGDGGWRRIDDAIATRLRAAGISIVGLDAPRYFRTQRTPDEIGCALERIIRTYRLRWHRASVIVIGYSRGADVVPFMMNRIEPELLPSIRLVALLGLEPSVEMRYHPIWSLFTILRRREPQFDVKPEVERLRERNVLCVYGEDEGDTLCPQLDARHFRVKRFSGGHHFDGRYDEVAQSILDALK
jgi:type IV secretory pathway VirJ component